MLQLLLHHPGLLRLILHHENANGVAVAVIVHHADDEQGEAMLIGLIGGIHPHNGVAIELEHAELVWCLMHQQKFATAIHVWAEVAAIPRCLALLHPTADSLLVHFVELDVKEGLPDLVVDGSISREVPCIAWIHVRLPILLDQLLTTVPHDGLHVAGRDVLQCMIFDEVTDPRIHGQLCHITPGPGLMPLVV